MANPSALVSHWVGEVVRAEGELCPECFVSALVWIPYYTHIGTDVTDCGTSLRAFRRVMCRDCGMVRNISL